MTAVEPKGRGDPCDVCGRPFAVGDLVFALTRVGGSGPEELYTCELCCMARLDARQAS